MRRRRIPPRRGQARPAAPGNRPRSPRHQPAGAAAGGGMRQLESPNWSLFNVGWGAAFVGRTISAMTEEVLTGYVLGLCGLLAMVVSLRPVLGSVPFIKRLRHRWEERRLAAGRRAAQEELRQQVEPWLKGWDVFNAAAGKVVTLFYALRDAEPQPAADWNSFRDATRLAIGLAGELDSTFSGLAYLLLKPFSEVEHGALEQCSVAACELSDWLSRWNRELTTFRRQAGLPPPASRPSSTASG